MAEGEGLSTGGVDIGGFIGQLGGTLPGLDTITKTLSRGPEWHQLYRASRMPGKDFNDQPVGMLDGSSDGKPAYDSGGFSGAAEDLGGLL